MARNGLVVAVALEAQRDGSNGVGGVRRCPFPLRKACPGPGETMHHGNSQESPRRAKWLCGATRPAPQGPNRPPTIFPGGSTMRSIILTALLVAAALPTTFASETVHTWATDRDYVDISNGDLYAYDSLNDRVTFKGRIDNYAPFIAVVPTVCGDHDVCVAMSVAVKDNVDVTWEVHASHDSGGSDVRAHGPHKTPNTGLVTFVTGASYDNFEEPGSAYVRLLFNGAFYRLYGPVRY